MLRRIAETRAALGNDAAARAAADAAAASRPRIGDADLVAACGSRPANDPVWRDHDATLTSSNARFPGSPATS